MSPFRNASNSLVKFCSFRHHRKFWRVAWNWRPRATAICSGNRSFFQRHRFGRCRSLTRFGAPAPMKFLARLKSRGKMRSKLFRYGWKITLVGLIAAGGFALLMFYGGWAASFDMKKVGAMPERNTVFDVDGKIYSRLAGSNRLKISLDEVSPYFIDALLAREDTRFYQHPGVDWRGILRALVRDILTRSAKEGASSITQQLARNSLPLGGRTLSRKLLEAMVALRIEQQFTKQQILELYVNRIYFGAGCYGVETASQAYFGKNASKLNLSEAALLAGVIRSPNRFFPFKKPGGRGPATRHCLGSNGGAEKNLRGRGEPGQARQGQSPSQASAPNPGKL